MCRDPMVSAYCKHCLGPDLGVDGGECLGVDLGVDGGDRVRADCARALGEWLRTLGEDGALDARSSSQFSGDSTRS